MRALRTLALMVMTISLLATPALTLAQSDGSVSDGAYALARQPNGQLPLEGTSWRLEGYQHRDRDGVPGPESAAYIALGASSFDGSGGCSRVRGRYGVAGRAITFVPRRLKGRSCAENLTLVQMAVENGLNKAASYEIVPGDVPGDDKLLFRSAGGDEILRYGLDDISSLEMADWVLSSYTVGGEEVAASTGQLAVLSFQPQANAVYKRRQSGPLTASTGCNGIVSVFYRHADVLSFSPLERTDAPCTPELAEQEEAMAAVLDATSIILDLPYDRLVLTSSDTGERLELVSQTPLESTTWLVDVDLDRANPNLRPSLRMADGAAVGEGPCGPYTASYVSDGWFITYRNVQGARDDECAELKAEKVMLDGLRDAVRVDREGNRITLRDAGGSKTLQARAPTAP
jgi:heat shock protein HslJ